MLAEWRRDFALYSLQIYIFGPHHPFSQWCSFLKVFEDNCNKQIGIHKMHPTVHFLNIISSTIYWNLHHCPKSLLKKWDKDLKIHEYFTEHVSHSRGGASRFHWLIYLNDLPNVSNIFSLLFGDDSVHYRNRSFSKTVQKRILWKPQWRRTLRKLGVIVATGITKVAKFPFTLHPHLLRKVVT